MINSLQKQKKVKLIGKAVAKLNDDVHKRDHDQCIIKACRAYVDPGEKFHHEPCGKDKSDEIEKAVLLCGNCHYERHHGLRSAEIRQECREYLKEKYGCRVALG